MKKCLFLLLMFILTSPVFAGVSIIVNNSVSDSSLSKAEIQDIFLGKVSKWSNGSEIILAIMESGDTHGAFLETLMEQSSSQFDRYWKKAIFTGTIDPPETFSDDSDVISFVKSNPGAVGYISDDSSASGVSVITVK